jgi:sugar phosphate isomerase/epimerase
VIGFRIAAQTSCFAQPFRKALHTLAQLGCDGVQIDARRELRPAELSDTGLRQLRKLLDDLNLRVGAVAFPTRRGLSSSDDLQRRVEATIEAMRFASRLGARVLICTLGGMTEAADDPLRATLTDVLATLASHSHRLGVRLAAQTGDTKPQVLNDFLATLPEGSLGLNLHPAQLITHGISPQEFVSTVGQHIFHVHAIDAVHDLSGGGSTEVELGRGSVDFPALVGQLEEHNYRDWLTIERRHSSQPMEDVGNSVKFLRSL